MEEWILVLVKSGVCAYLFSEIADMNFIHGAKNDRLFTFVYSRLRMLSDGIHSNLGPVAPLSHALLTLTIYKISSRFPPISQPQNFVIGEPRYFWYPVHLPKYFRNPINENIRDRLNLAFTWNFSTN